MRTCETFNKLTKVVIVFLSALYDINEVEEGLLQANKMKIETYYNGWFYDLIK